MRLALCLVLAAGCASRAPAFPQPIDLPTDGGTLPAAAPVHGDPRNESLFFVEGGAGRLRVSDGGDKGTPIVFVHGLGSSRDAWREALAALRPARRSVAYDQRGHGESDPARDGKYDIDALADDLDRVVSALHFDKFFLVGHSMAGQVLAAYAGKHADKLAGLLFVDCVGDLHDVPPDDVQHLLQQFTSLTPQSEQELFSQMLGPQAKPQTRERVLADVKRVKPEVIAAVWTSVAKFDARTPLSKWHGPALAFDTPENDFPLSLWRALPGVKREVLPGTSHWLMMDDPKAFEDVLRRFAGAP